MVAARGFRRNTFSIGPVLGPPCACRQTSRIAISGLPADSRTCMSLRLSPYPRCGPAFCRLAPRRAGAGRRACACRAAAACEQTFQRGYVLPEGALEQIPLGSSQEQVLIVLGTPSTVATVSGEAFYYISQRGREGRRLPAAEGRRSARGRGLFRQGAPRRAARRLRPEGRQDFRLRQPHDADRRQRTVLPHLPVQDHRHATNSAVRVSGSRKSKEPALLAGLFRFRRLFDALSARGSPAAAAPRCW